MAEYAKDARQWIISYYDDNCGHLLQEVDQLAQNHSYDDAIALLGQIPRESTCAASASPKIATTFQKRVNYQCESVVNHTKVYRAQKSYDSALANLLSMPIGSACSAQIDMLIDDVKNDICTVYVHRAEAYEATKNHVGALESLIGIESMSSECAQRKRVLETRIRSRLDRQAQLAWDRKIKEYDDNLALTIKEMDQDFALGMAKIGVEAHARAERLKISADVEKARWRAMAEIQRYQPRPRNDPSGVSVIFNNIMNSIQR